MPASIVKKILEGQDLFLRAKIPNHIVVKYTSEVVLMQRELDSILEKFNQKISKLQGKKIPKVEVKFNGNGEIKLAKMTEAQKAILLKKSREEEKGGGGIPL